MFAKRNKSCGLRGRSLGAWELGSLKPSQPTTLPENAQTPLDLPDPWTRVQLRGDGAGG